MIYAEARAKGDEMADAAKSAGKGVDDQVAAAAEGAMDSMNSEHAKVSDVVSAAYKSAKETGLEEGLTEPAAQTSSHRCHQGRVAQVWHVKCRGLEQFLILL